ncbi:MAG: hypothetical protein AAF789_04155 [Bacteroidota bacterium]
MKKILIGFTALFLLTTTEAQEVTEKKLLGTWKMVFNVEEGIEREAEEADNLLEEVLIKSIGGFVGGLLDEIDIYFTFQNENRVKIRVEAYDDVETGKGIWRINKDGGLEIREIEGDVDKVDIDTDDDVWYMKDGKLVNADKDAEDKVYMEKID